MNNNKPLPEITLKAVVLGIFLSIILAGANAYLGLFAGLTVSASIPAAVLSMAILRLFKESNILENNIVQTAASAGESLAAGVIFTIPALVILKHWQGFDYTQTTIIAALGGVIGVLFTVPLRRALIVEENLKFPEGIATAEVLKAGDSGDGVKYMVTAGIIGALFKFGETGLKAWHGTVEIASRVGNGILYVGSNVSPALVSVGYIVGLNIAILVFVGGAINWLVAIPLFAMYNPWPKDATAASFAWDIWSGHTRYLGVGAMAVGGLWALVNLIKPIVKGVKASLSAYKGGEDGEEIPSTEKDTPITWVATALVLSLIPICALYYYVIGEPVPSAIMSVIMLIAGFLFSAVAAYMAGLVGSSNNPISGITIATILFTSLLLSYMMTDTAAGPAAAIFVGGVVCCAAAIGGDNLQDLKAGHIVGATPWKQQIMQMIGVVSAALVLAPILMLIDKAYGIGVKTAEHPEPLLAPQASLMASVAKGVFEGGLPWLFIGIGAAIAVVIIVLDKIQEARKSNFRLPVLAVAVGIYLPIELAVPILLGGIIAAVSEKAIAKWQNKEEGEAAQTRGLLFASGLITGEALVGILIAIPIVVSGKKDLLSIGWNAWYPGVILLAIVMFMLLRSAMPKKA
ncbi:OPT family oligopeptide transporter [Candidatus Uabimicrobium amorphum]|uniref:Oligopeptide transporter n=1 Tax=Uabimicrobium amorphum TaxID=2596890 RepID=A0A5S9F379_UABAM|nr:oligopeptide transporter, OPT family [Candidatus Uabimicrobium amorphum]BBM83259.1 oligopeptide transporter [Candidatus Uabimicrobium amorphum]